MNERVQDEKFDDVGPKITQAKELKAAITLKNITKYGIALLLTLSITSDINLTNWLASRYFVMRIQAKAVTKVSIIVMLLYKVENVNFGWLFAIMLNDILSPLKKNINLKIEDVICRITIALPSTMFMEEKYAIKFDLLIR